MFGNLFNKAPKAARVESVDRDAIATVVRPVIAQELANRNAPADRIDQLTGRVVDFLMDHGVTGPDKTNEEAVRGAITRVLTNLE